MAQNTLQKKLKELGSKLLKAPVSSNSIVKLLKQTASCLSEIEQSPPKSVLDSMKPCISVMVKDDYLNHQDKDVRVLVATSICEIMRITAPEPPYSDDVLRDAFHLIVSTFGDLEDKTSPSFGRRVAILETLAKYRSCVVMLDIECDDLVNEMFSLFLSSARDDYPDCVLMSMQTIMSLLLDESEVLQEDLVLVLLATLGHGESDETSAARRLAMNVIENCAEKLEACITRTLISVISGKESAQEDVLNYHEAIYSLYCCAPQILQGVLPYIAEELLADQVDIRLKAVNLLGRMFAVPGRAISEAFKPLFSEFLKRITDRAVDVRISVVKYVKAGLVSNPSQPEGARITASLMDRLLDYDENVRKHVVEAVCELAQQDFEYVSMERIKTIADRLRDKSVSVKRCTFERLIQLYRNHCLKCLHESSDNDEYYWIPAKILRCFYDKDLRYEVAETIIADTLMSFELSVENKVKHWIAAFSEFEKIEIRAFEQALLQKQRLQKELQRYMELRQKSQDAHDAQIRISGCFRTMSRSFKDPSKAGENFQSLNQLKDTNIWRIMSSLLESSTGYVQALATREELLEALGERHPLYSFMSDLSTKSSYLLFNKEHVGVILQEVFYHKSSQNTKLVKSSLNLLVILASFFPTIFRGAEDQLVLLLKEDDEVIVEGIVHILAKCGGVIRNQLPMLSSSVDLLLERLCIEGTSKQAQYSVQALAAITVDDGLKSLSMLYKRLLDMLEKEALVPAVFQALGCIAQIATPIFETREDEVVKFISNKVMNSSGTDISHKHWDDQSEKCVLKIYAIKALVKSYLPLKDAHLRAGLERLLEMLRNLLSYGEISTEVKSSTVDKSHLRLSSAKAILRLSKVWDHKIPVGLFHLTVRTSQDKCPEVRKEFLSKVYQYTKDRILDAKYVVAFALPMKELPQDEYEENKRRLNEIVEMSYRDLRSRQLVSSSGPSSDSPEQILSYFIHVIAHDSAFPEIDERPEVNMFEPVFWSLYTFIDALVHQDVEKKQDSDVTGIQERVRAVASVLNSIKNSNDVVDISKSRNAHIVCELGFVIIKLLHSKELDLLASPQPASLPPVLYSTVEQSTDNGSSGQRSLAWLPEDVVFNHFRTLKSQKSSGSGTIDGSILKDKDDAEVSLGKFMKLLKSKKSKHRVATANRSSGAKAAQDEMDILRMVKEIEVENFSVEKGMETENAAKDRSPSIMEKRDQEINGTITENKTKGVRKSKEAGSGGKIMQDNPGRYMSSAVLATPAPQPRYVDQGLSQSQTGQKKKISGSNLNIHEHVDGEVKRKRQEISSTAEKVESVSPKENLDTYKKRRTSIAGLSKCTSKEDGTPDFELVGCRIKVWWPLDKAFYEGVVQSFDQKKKKHVVLYNDGDLETLRLDKEKWERVEHTDAQKEERAPSPSPPGEMQLEKSNKSQTNPSKQTENSLKKGGKGKKRARDEVEDVQPLEDHADVKFHKDDLMENKPEPDDDSCLPHSERDDMDVENKNTDMFYEEPDENGDKEARTLLQEGKDNSDQSAFHHADEGREDPDPSATNQEERVKGSSISPAPDHEDERKENVDPSALSHEEESRENEDPSALSHEEERKENQDPSAGSHEEECRENEDPSALSHEEGRTENVDPSALPHEEGGKENEDPSALPHEEGGKENEDPSALPDEEERKVNDDPSVLSHEDGRKESDDPSALPREEERKENDNPSELSREEERKGNDNPSALSHEEERKENDDQSALCHEEGRKESDDQSVLSHQEERKESDDPSALSHEEGRKEDDYPSGLSHEEERKENEDPSALAEERKEDNYPSGLSHEEERKENEDPSALAHEEERKGNDDPSAPSQEEERNVEPNILAPSTEEGNDNSEMPKLCNVEEKKVEHGTAAPGHEEGNPKPEISASRHDSDNELLVTSIAEQLDT